MEKVWTDFSVHVPISLRGIVNGIDYNDFNPETDINLSARYNATTFRKEKVKNKIQLQKDFGT